MSAHHYSENWHWVSNSNALCKHAKNTNTNFMDFLESKDFDSNKVTKFSLSDWLVFFDDPHEMETTVMKGQEHRLSHTLRVMYKTEQRSMTLVAKGWKPANTHQQ